MRNLRNWLFIVIGFLSLQVFAGGESGAGGGNGSVAEFRRIAMKIGDAFFEQQVMYLDGHVFNQEPFIEAAASVILEGTHEKLILNSQNVMAINYPARNTIKFNTDEWSKLNQDSKNQLVIHELLGLKYRGIYDDSSYKFSTLLMDVLKNYSVQEVALAMARAEFAGAYQMKVIPQRTKLVETINAPDEAAPIYVYEIAIQTFENGSSQSVRVYHVTMHSEGGVIKAELFNIEGPAGP